MAARQQRVNPAGIAVTTSHDTDTLLPATAIILAGGQGARMGGADKALLRWGEGTMLEHAVEQAALVAREVLVVGGHAREVAPAALRQAQDRPRGRVGRPERSRGAARVPDLFEGCGPLGGLHAGLTAATFERCVALGCDMPFASPLVLRALVEMSEGYDAAVPRAADGLHPLLAVYSRRCLPAIADRLEKGRRRLISFLDQVRVRWVTEAELRPLDPDLRCLFNINTWQDYRRALALAGSGREIARSHAARCD